MQLEVWSDIACPFCYIGKRQFERALAGFAHRDEVALAWRSFQLDPDMPRSVEGDLHDLLARKLGRTREEAIAMNARVAAMAADVGLEYRLDLVRPTNTRDAHQLIQMAPPGALQQAVTERLFRAYFVEGADLGDHATLVALGGDAGLETATVETVLATAGYADAVIADTREAQGLGLNAVPAFVLDRRFAISGAQGEQVLLGALERAWEAARRDAVAG